MAAPLPRELPRVLASKMPVAGALIYRVLALSSALTGWIFDYWITAAGSVSRVRKSVKVSALVGAAAFMIMCSVATSGWPSPLLAIAAFFFGLGSPKIFAIAQTLSGLGAAGQWMGFQNTVGNLSGIAAAIIPGWTIEVTGEY